MLGKIARAFVNANWENLKKENRTVHIRYNGVFVNYLRQVTETLASLWIRPHNQSPVRKEKQVCNLADDVLCWLQPLKLVLCDCHQSEKGEPFLMELRSVFFSFFNHRIKEEDLPPELSELFLFLKFFSVRIRTLHLIVSQNCVIPLLWINSPEPLSAENTHSDVYQLRISKRSSTDLW